MLKPQIMIDPSLKNNNEIFKYFTKNLRQYLFKCKIKISVHRLRLYVGFGLKAGHPFSLPKKFHWAKLMKYLTFKL